MVDEALIADALRHAGAGIHGVSGMVGLYRTFVEAQKVTEAVIMERALRKITKGVDLRQVDREASLDLRSL
jgi:hypothetical protein